MTAILPTDTDHLDRITAMIARRMTIGSGAVLPFADVVDLLSGLFTAFGGLSSRLVAAGHVTPEVAQAADRAQAGLEELIQRSPFAGDATMVTEAVSTPHDIVYLANPNRVTGATYSRSELESIARAVPEGALIVDEHYYDYFGVTAAPLTELYSNIVCLRSFTASFSINSADAGFVLGSPSAIEKIAQAHRGYVFTRALCRTVETTLNSGEIMAQRLREVHEEALRIAQEAEACGVQCRLSPTDFVLMRVADPKEFGNALARNKVAIENLDGYPQMKNYVRYRVQSPRNNDCLIRTIERMAPKNYRMNDRDRRPAVVRHASENATVSSRPLRSTRFDADTTSSAANERRTGLAKEAMLED